MSLHWKEGAGAQLIHKRSGRGGAFPEFKQVGLVKTVKLHKIKCLGRGVPREELIETDYEKRIHTYVRLKCPHCPGELRVREGPSFHKNRNTLVRDHLLECEGWKWIIPPPRKQVKGKPMAGKPGLKQSGLPWIARLQEPRCVDCDSSSADPDSNSSTVSSNEITGVETWVERLVVTPRALAEGPGEQP